MAAPAAVGRKVFAPYFSTDPTKITAGLALFTTLTPGQQNHVLGHLLYLVLLQLGRMDVTADKILEEVEAAFEQVSGTLSGEGTDEDLPPHLQQPSLGGGDEADDGDADDGDADADDGENDDDSGDTDGGGD